MGDVHHHLGGQLVVPGQGEAFRHAVLVEQDVWIREVIQQPLAEALFGLLDDLALAQGGAVPDTGTVGGTHFIHVDELLVAGGILDIAKLELGVDEDLIERGQGLADDVETILEQRLVAVDVRRGAETEGLMVALYVGTGDVDVVRFRHAIQPLEDPLGRRGDEDLGQLLILLQPFRQRDAAELALAVLVGTPHGAGDVLAGDGFDHHRAGLLHYPDEGVRYVQDVAVRQPLLLEQLEPVAGDGIECSPLARHAVQAIHTLPDAVEGRNAVADHHEGERRIGRHIIAFLSYEPGTVCGGQPVDAAHFAGMDRFIGTDRQIVIHRQYLICKTHG